MRRELGLGFVLLDRAKGIAKMSSAKRVKREPVDNSMTATEAVEALGVSLFDEIGSFASSGSFRQVTPGDGFLA